MRARIVLTSLIALIIFVPLILTGSGEVQAGRGFGRVISRDVIEVNIDSGVSLGNFIFQGEMIKDASVFPGESFTWGVSATNPFYESVKKVAHFEIEPAEGAPGNASDYIKVRIDIPPNRVLENGIRSGQPFTVEKSGTYLFVSMSARSGAGVACFKNISVRFEELYHGNWIEIQTTKLAENFCIKESISSRVYPPQRFNGTLLGGEERVKIGHTFIVPVVISNIADTDQEICVSVEHTRSRYGRNAEIDFLVDKSDTRTRDMYQGICIMVPGGESGGKSTVWAKITPILGVSSKVPPNVNVAIEVSILLGD